MDPHLHVCSSSGDGDGASDSLTPIPRVHPCQISLPKGYPLFPDHFLRYKPYSVAQSFELPFEDKSLRLHNHFKSLRGLYFYRVYGIRAPNVGHMPRDHLHGLSTLEDHGNRWVV